MPADQPAEIAPVVAELNALLDQNRAEPGARPRPRTPTSPTPSRRRSPPCRWRSPSPPATGTARCAGRVDDMDRRVRHHLRRARAAALAGSARGRTALAPRLSDLRAALTRIHAEKGAAIDLDVPETLSVSCEGQDLDEMLGNLVDNACRWCRVRVRVSATARDGAVAVSVEDDGPGLDPAASAVMARGRRLDEGRAGPRLPGCRSPWNSPSCTAAA
ncbi:ATP-binding protein [Methylobacterium oryzae CBMB20]